MFRSRCSLPPTFHWRPRSTVDLVLRDGSISNDYADHQNRTPPSKSPGIDIISDEGLKSHSSYGDTPVVRSPVSGIVTFLYGTFGTVKVRENGTGRTWKIMHLFFSESHKVKNARTSEFGLDLGQQVYRGDPLGRVGNKASKSYIDARRRNGKGPLKPHVHISVYDREKQVIDPKDTSTFGNDGNEVDFDLYVDDDGFYFSFGGEF